MVFEFCQQRNLACETDHIKICGQGVEDLTHYFQTDTFGSSSDITIASSFSQIGRLYVLAVEIAFSAPSIAHILFRNPADNNRTMYLDKYTSGIGIVNIGQQPQEPMHYECEIITHISLDLTATVNGFHLNGWPMNVGFSEISSIEIRGLIDAQLDINKELFLTRQLNEMITVDFAGRIILPPGHDFFFSLEAKNITTPFKSIDQSLTISFYEL